MSAPELRPDDATNSEMAALRIRGLGRRIGNVRVLGLVASARAW
jgi:hypothetical protein